MSCRSEIQGYKKACKRRWRAFACTEVELCVCVRVKVWGGGEEEENIFLVTWRRGQPERRESDPFENSFDVHRLLSFEVGKRMYYFMCDSGCCFHWKVFIDVFAGSWNTEAAEADDARQSPTPLPLVLGDCGVKSNIKLFNLVELSLNTELFFLFYYYFFFGRLEERKFFLLSVTNGERQVSMTNDNSTKPKGIGYEEK